MKNFLDYASKKYHEGSPVITDTEFDALAEQHDYESVGAEVGRHGIPHHFPMWSLKKCYVGEKQIELTGEKVTTPKLDGAAISILYIGGSLVMALTRGDGKRGEDITDKVKFLVSNTLINSESVAQITGEIVAPKTIANARNYAAGALNLKDLEEFKNRALTFVAYGIQVSDKAGRDEHYDTDMQFLVLNGFRTVIDFNLEEFPTDGQVIRLNSNKDFDAAGFTSSHPRGAYALKTRGEGVRTILRRVDWQVGRTGVVSPVAILDPIVIGEATVSRATLHNMKYIEELGLEIGCTVEVIRSGEIIPRVVRRINA